MSVFAVASKDPRYLPKKKTATTYAEALEGGKLAVPNVMTKEQAVAWIKSSGSKRIFACDCIKRLTGTSRHFVCRYGVKNRVKGVGLRFNPEAKRLLVIFDYVKLAYRMLNIPGLKGLVIQGKYVRIR